VTGLHARGLRAPAAVALGLAVMLVASNLRPAVAVVGPLLHRIEVGAGLSNAAASALTTLPVLCYGIVALAAPWLARRLGVHAAVAVALLLLTAGQLIRLITGVGFLFLGTAFAGAAIAIGNVLMPVVVRADFPARTGAAMTAFSTTLMGFAALAAGVSVPVANALGGGWRPGLAVWAVPAGLGAVVWLPALIRRRRSAARRAAPAVPDQPPRREVRRLVRKPLAWQITLFFALQSGGFYSTLAWLPSILRSHGYSEAHSGVLLSVSLVVGTFTGLAIPTLAHRMRDQRMLVLACALLSSLGWLGILLAPTTAAYLWVVILGLGQNAGFPLMMMIIVLRGGSVVTTQTLSAMSQSVGYILAALAPLAVGTLHGLTHSWTPEVILLLALILPQFLLGLGAGRDQQLAEAAPAGFAGSEPPAQATTPAP